MDVSVTRRHSIAILRTLVLIQFYLKHRRSSLEMALLPVLLFLIIHITNSNAGIISSSGLQRVSIWQTRIFQWTVDETIVSYNVYNQTTGSQTPLSLSSNYSKVDSVISLTIINIQLWDAGNYSLLVTTDKSTYVDSTACLFVYGSIQGSVNLMSGANTATEGDTVELACSLTSTSLPASYRTGIYYAWGNWKYGQFQNISSGTAMLSSGDLLPGYTIKNNGRTFHISSVRYPDDQYIYCYGIEDASYYGWNSFTYYFQLRYQPYISSLNPVSKKFIAIVGTSVTLSLYSQANPQITSFTNWTFVNSAGISQDLPPDSVTNYNFNYQSLRFNFTSVGFYGSYSITHSNAVGTTTTTFKVLPQGPPDAPSNLKLYYASHCAVSFQWNRMWSNTVAGQQMVIMRLRLSDTNTDVQTFNSSYYYENFNVTQTSTFTNNIQPLTNYNVSVWSVNSFGSSEVVEMKVRTRSQPKLSVSPQMISINGNQAIINFTVELGENAENILQIAAQCCSTFSGQCASNFTKYTINQIAVNNLPNGTDYYIDVTVYSGINNKYNYYSDTVKGVKVSRNGNVPPSDCEDKQSSPVAVIVLACLLGVAVVALLAILIVYLVKTSGQRHQPAKPPKLPADAFLNMSRPRAKEERPPSNVDDIYEPMDMDSSNDQNYYTGINGSNGDEMQRF